LKLKNLSGVWIPICTPFTEGEIDIDKLGKNMEVYSHAPLGGYFALGSNGEACMLDSRERIKALQIIVKNKGENQLVMVGCGHESARGTIALIEEVAGKGADIVSIITPHYFKKAMTDKALIAFYEKVADNSTLPVVLYNAPGFAGGVQLSVRALVKLSEHPNIIGMKDSSSIGPNIFLAYANKENFSILAGSANFLLPSLVMGAAGGVLSLANFLPYPCCFLYKFFQEGEMEKAIKLQQAILRVNNEVSGAYGVAGVKAAMDFTGFYGGDPRLPLLPLSSKEKENILLILKKFTQQYPEFKHYLKS